jgi:hypothetical protein
MACVTFESSWLWSRILATQEPQPNLVTWVTDQICRGCFLEAILNYVVYDVKRLRQHPHLQCGYLLFADGKVLLIRLSADVLRICKQYKLLGCALIMQFCSYLLVLSKYRVTRETISHRPECQQATVSRKNSKDQLVLRQ